MEFLIIWGRGASTPNKKLIKLIHPNLEYYGTQLGYNGSGWLYYVRFLEGFGPAVHSFNYLKHDYKSEITDLCCSQVRILKELENVNTVRISYRRFVIPKRK